MSLRRGLLLGVAALLSATAALAVAILLFGDVGATEGRILTTTAVLAGSGVLALPVTLLWGRALARPLLRDQCERNVRISAGSTHLRGSAGCPFLFRVALAG
jgi:uncharacterized membrane protein required for colicin V production